MVASSDIQSKHGEFYGLYFGGWMFMNGLIQQFAFLKVVLDTQMARSQNPVKTLICSTPLSSADASCRRIRAIFHDIREYKGDI